MSAPPMTEQQLAEIEARARAATPGPWSVVYTEHEHLADSPRCRETCGQGQQPSTTYVKGAKTLHSMPGTSVEDIAAPTDPHIACWGHDYDDYGGMAAQDAEFVAHARLDVPALVAEVQRLRAALGEATAAPTFFERLDQLPKPPESGLKRP